MNEYREQSPSHLVVARDKPGLLAAMIRTLAGNANISLEGDLSRVDLHSIPGVSTMETTCLKRITKYPRLDFAVCPLEPETIKPLLLALLPEARAVHDVVHIQIEKNGELAFAAFDNFHPDCIVAWPAVPASTLDTLLETGVIRSFGPLGAATDSENPNSD